MEHEQFPIARTERPDATAPGTLFLEEDSRGLKVLALLDPEDPDVQQLKRKMSSHLVDEMSFAFRCLDDEWNSDYTDRKVKAVSLHGGDVSVVTFGASPTTGSTTSIRSADGECEFRAGKALSKSTEAQIQTLVDTLAKAGEGLSDLLPDAEEPAAVVPFEGFSTNGRSMMPDIHIHLNEEVIRGAVAKPEPEAPVVEPEVETLSMPESLEGEWREKYPEENRADIDATSGGYFGVDETDLVKVIQNVSRGNEKYDTVRASAVKWAEALKLPELIPDNWVSDTGALTETNGVWGDTEARESYNDQRALVEDAVKDMLQDEKGDGECYVYCYVLDMSSDWAVYRYEGDLYRVDFTQEGDVVTLGDAVKVRPIATFEPVTEPPPARSARAFDWAAQEQEIELLKRRAA
jgi:HK97 family phage prohead protease